MLSRRWTQRRASFGWRRRVAGGAAVVVVDRRRGSSAGRDTGERLRILLLLLRWWWWWWEEEECCCCCRCSWRMNAAVVVAVELRKACFAIAAPKREQGEAAEPRFEKVARAVDEKEQAGSFVDDRMEQ